jgi:hypothetical protein
MRIFHNRGTNEVSLGLTARNFDNKLNSIEKYDKREFKSILKRFHRKGEKVRSVVITYTWGYKTKEPNIYYSRVKFPFGTPITPQNLIAFATADIEEKHGYYLEKESDETNPLPYFLREVSFLFISESEKRQFKQDKPQQTDIPF